MRSGIWRGLAVAIAVGGFVLNGAALEARADGLFHHTIPRETLAMDYRTGDVMMAPPIPYGEYAKDYAGAVHGAAGMTFGAIHGLVSHVKGICSKCGGAACGLCGGKGHRHGKSCDGCGGDGCGRCGSGLLGHGGSLLHHGGADGGACASGKCGHGKEHVGLLHHDGSGLGQGGLGHGHAGGSGVACVGPGCSTGHATPQTAPHAPAKTMGPTAAPQVMPSTQIQPVCGGCLGTGQLRQGGGCGLCGGTGRLGNLFGHGRRQGGGSMCGGCGGRGCGACGGRGLMSGLCGKCKGAGCGDCGGAGGHGVCKNCGGAGCGLCAHLKGKAHSLLGLPMGLAGKLLHKGEIKYFVGPGGPVPITPGYVPYVVSTRSPRDFLAFPPFSDQTP